MCIPFLLQELQFMMAMRKQDHESSMELKRLELEQQMKIFQMQQMQRAGTPVHRSSPTAPAVVTSVAMTSPNGREDVDSGDGEARGKK